MVQMRQRVCTFTQVFAVMAGVGWNYGRNFLQSPNSLTNNNDRDDDDDEQMQKKRVRRVR